MFKVLDRYVLLDQIAQGATAQLYRAMQFSMEGIGRLVTLKVFQPEFLGHSESAELYYKNQVELMMAFNHPNIVHFYDQGKTVEGTPFVVMDYIRGPSLRKLIMDCGQKKVELPVSFALYFFKEVAKAIHYAHCFGQAIGLENEKKILHRNLSLHNILITYEGNIKIIEFGLLPPEKKSGEIAPQYSKMARGRSSYVSPEELQGQVLDEKSDLFSLGVSLWEVLTRRSLFTGSNREETYQNILNSDQKVTPPSICNKFCPKELDQFVLKLLSNDKKLRPETAEAVAQELEKLLYQVDPDFGMSHVRNFLENFYDSQLTQDIQSLKDLHQKATQFLSGMSDTERNAYLSKIEKEANTRIGVQTRILINKNKEFANGARTFDYETLEKNSVDLKLDTDAVPVDQKQVLRGGYVKRNNQHSAQVAQVFEKQNESYEEDSGFKAFFKNRLIQVALGVAALYLLLPLITGGEGLMSQIANLINPSSKQEAKRVPAQVLEKTREKTTDELFK